MNHLKKIPKSPAGFSFSGDPLRTKTQIVKLLGSQNPNDLRDAHNLFDLIPNPTVFLYNKLIQAYASQNQPHQCLSLYSRMCRRGCPLNGLSFTFLFPAFVALPSSPYGKILHAHFEKSGFELDMYASTALVDMYAKAGLLSLARKKFDEMPQRDVPTWNSMITGYSRSGDMVKALELFDMTPVRNVVTWTAIVSGYSQNGQYSKALEMFLRMEKEKGIRPNEVTLACVLAACANIGALGMGERIEAYARGNGMLKNIYVSNSLLEMYAKCGKIEVARRLFGEIGKMRNLCSWNSMIMGFAVHGRSNEALQLYDQMLQEGTLPDDVTFVGLLLACTHGRMVSKGRELFKSMERQYRIAPKLEHYGCMVDLLGRAGELQESYNLMKSMPMKPDSVIWGTLLGACSFHNNVEIAEIAAEALFELEPWNSGNHVILSNIYASAGRMNDVAKVRKLMKGDQLTKAAGYSLIEGEGKVNKFMVADASHPRSCEIYSILDEILAWMKLQRSWNNFEVEVKESTDALAAFEQVNSLLTVERLSR